MAEDKSIFGTLVGWGTVIGGIGTLAAVIIPLLTTPPPDDELFRLEYDSDRQGSDIKRILARDINQCQDECAKLGNCRSFTFVPKYEQPPSRDNDTPVCWLKDAVPARAEQEGMITGIRE